MSRRRIVTAFVCVALFVIAGCSGDDDDNGDASNTTSTTATSTSTTSSTSTGSAETSVPSTGTTSGSTPAGGLNTLAPVGVGEPAELAGNLFVTVTSVAPTTFTGDGPGETSGPGVIVTVEVRNETSDAIDLGRFAINAHDSDGIPAVPNRVPGEALAGTIAPGERKAGDYGFRVAPGREGSVVIDIQHSGAPNVAIVDAAK